MKISKILYGVAATMVAATMLAGMAACSGEEGQEGSSSHEHSYTNGVCECGDYEVDFITSLPMSSALQAECDEQGTVVSLTYTTRSYALESLPENEGQTLTVEKELLVYLPYNYDETKQYNVLYLMHGTGDDHTYWLEKMGTVTRNVLDNMIKDGKCEPTIVVTPSYYSIPEGYGEYDSDDYDYSSDPNADLWPMYFWQELRQDIIPLVESTYSTYAGGDVSEENLSATRDHRAFAGLSRGSMTSVNSAMMHCLDLFSYIGSYSGIWADFDDFKAALEGEFAQYDVKYWYNNTGTADTVGDAMNDQVEFIEQVKENMSDRFTDGVNLALVILPGGAHSYNSWIIGLYNSLLVFFK